MAVPYKNLLVTFVNHVLEEETIGCEATTKMQESEYELLRQDV